MAKAAQATDAFSSKLREIDSKVQEQEAAVAKAQDALRANPDNADLRRAVHEAKAPLMGLSIERGFYARAVSEAAGGKSYSPPA